MQVNIDVPRKLSEKQQQILRELAEHEHANVTPQLKSFLDKVKKYFVADTETAKTED